MAAVWLRPPGWVCPGGAGANAARAHTMKKFGGKRGEVGDLMKMVEG